MIREQPVINSLNVELAAPSAGLALSTGRLGADSLSATATTWTTYLGSALDVSIRRGGKRQGVSTSIDVGTLTMTLLNVGDPRTDAAVRPNTAIRVRSRATGAAIFTGRILDVNMAHQRNKVTGNFDRYITLTAVDSVTAHANTKRYGAIAPNDHETFEQRINRLALSSRAPITTPAIAPARVLYQLPPGGTAAETEAGWTNLGGAAPREQFRANSVFASQTYVGTTLKQVVYRQAYYTGTWSDSSALTTYLDPAEGALGLVRTVTGLTPGKMYRLRATALLQLDGFGGDSAGLAANVYRLTAVGIGSGVSQRLSLGASVGYKLPAYEFIATGTSATVGIELADRFDASTGRGGYIERVGLGEFVLEEMVTAGSHMLASVAFESSLAEHFDVACASVAGGRWWVNAGGVTQFAAGPLTGSAVASFCDVRPTATSARATYAWAGTANRSESTETVGGVSRRNLATLPNAVALWTGWAGTNGTLTYSYLPDSGLDFPSTFVRLTQTKDATALLVGPGVSSVADVVAGKTYTVSMFGRSSRAGASHVRARFTGGGAEVVSALTTHQVGAWERRSLTFTAPSTGKLTVYFWWNVIAKVGDTFDGTALLVEEGSTTAAYFDGSRTTPNEYVGLDTSFDTRNMVNDLTLTNRVTGVNDQGETVGVDTDSGFTDPTSIATWGTRSDSLKVSIYGWDGFTGAVARRASEVLAASSSPVLTLSSIQWNASEDPALAGSIDVYSPITVTFQGTTQPSQIISVSHDITPSRWLITLDLVRNT